MLLQFEAPCLRIVSRVNWRVYFLTMTLIYWSCSNDCWHGHEQTSVTDRDVFLPRVGQGFTDDCPTGQCLLSFDHARFKVAVQFCQRRNHWSSTCNIHLYVLLYFISIVVTDIILHGTTSCLALALHGVGQVNALRRMYEIKLSPYFLLCEYCWGRHCQSM